MSENVVFVDPETKVTEVARILFDNKFHGVPVIKDRKVVGIITEDDFFIKNSGNLFLPSYINFLKEVDPGGQMAPENIEKMNRLMDSRAQDIMTHGCVTVPPDMETEKLLSLIKETKFNTLPVTDSRNNLIGIVTLMDIIGTIRGRMEKLSLAHNRLEKNTREVDGLALSFSKWISRKFSVVEKGRINVWKKMALLAFVMGLIFSFFWFAAF